MEEGRLLALGSGGWWREVRRWRVGEVELRVVRWTVRGATRGLLRWARGQDEDVEAAAPRRWQGGVALERREGPGGRWQTLGRQEIEGEDAASEQAARARLLGWEAGLLARGEKLAGRLAERE